MNIDYQAFAVSIAIIEGVALLMLSLLNGFLNSDRNFEMRKGRNAEMQIERLKNQLVAEQRTVAILRGSLEEIKHQRAKELHMKNSRSYEVEPIKKNSKAEFGGF